MNLLLLSNSTTHGYGYLEHAEELLKNYLGTNIKKVTFIPYAGVTVSYEQYTEKVANIFNKIGYELESIHLSKDYKSTILNAEALAVGGGNTFRLLSELYQYDLVELIREKVKNGMPYIGWSAGSNMACPSIKTTNDMPIVEPKSFEALNLIPFQINPHYTDVIIENHHGETRDQRLQEFLILNPHAYVAGLREGCSFLIQGNSIKHIGDKSLKIFQLNEEPKEMNSDDDISFLL